jgi:hypothetical protein
MDWQGAYVLNIRYRNYRIAKALGRAYHRYGQLATLHTNRSSCMMIWETHRTSGLFSKTGFNIPYDAERIHGISTELAAEKESLWPFWINSMRHWVKLNSL